MKFQPLAYFAAVALIGTTTGCAGTVVAGAPESDAVVVEEAGEDAPLGIPAGHLPPPGECRIWYPGEPPGQQPPPLPCAEAEASAPPGTWVLSRPLHERRLVHAQVIDPRHAGVVLEVRIYDAERGTYLRTERR